MTSNVGASVIEKGGRNFGFFLRPDDDGEAEADMSYNRIKTLVGGGREGWEGTKEGGGQGGRGRH